MNNIKLARQKAGLGQKEIAISLKVSQPTVSDWENGKVMPSGENLLNLADLLSASADYLLGRTNDPNLTNTPQAPFHIDLEQLNPLTGKKMTSREKKQYKETMENFAKALFFDDMISELDKEVMFKAISDAFWEAKEMNRRKKSVQFRLSAC